MPGHLHNYVPTFSVYSYIPVSVTFDLADYGLVLSSLVLV